MDWKHLAVLVVAFTVGFWAAKKFPGLFASIPGVNQVL